MPVSQILRMLAAGETISDLVTAYPYLKRADIHAALDYAANLADRAPAKKRPYPQPSSKPRR